MGKFFRNHLFIGVVCGIVGFALTFVGVYVPATDSFADFRNVPPIIAAFFVSPLAGFVAGAVAAIGRACMPFFGMGALTWFATSLGTFVAALVAVAMKKWVFYGAKPSFFSAALCGTAAELMNMLVVLVVAFRIDVYATIIMLDSAVVIQCVGAAVFTSLASLVFRSRQTVRGNLYPLAAGLFIALVSFLVWSVQNTLAIERATESVTLSMRDVMTGVDYPTEVEMLRSADQMVRRWGSATAMAREDMAALARKANYDFIGVVNEKGVLVAASQSEAVGTDFTKNEALSEFLQIGKSGRRYCVQPFREPSFPVPGKENRSDIKHVALGFRDGSGFVFLANAFGTIAERDYVLGDSMLDWHVGERGSFLLVDPRTGKVISGNENDRIGKTIEEVGLDKLKPMNDYFLRGTVLGVDSLVRHEELDFMSADVYAVLPCSEITYQRDFATLMTVIVMSIILVCVAMAFSTIFRQGKAIARLRAQEDARRQKDLSLAKSIQISALVREFPKGVYATMRPAREVGGDFYDCFSVAPGKLMIVIADVSGKGIPASLFMMRARTEFRAVSHETDNVADIMSEVNNRLCKNNVAEMFVTAWIGILDLSSGDFEWVSAGHNPPYVVGGDGKPRSLVGKRSLVLAGMENVKYKPNAGRLGKDDRLFLYTDGVTEAQSRTGDFFGEGRLETTLAAACSNSADETCRNVVRAVDAFAAGAPQADDITVMSVGPLSVLL